MPSNLSTNSFLLLPGLIKKWHNTFERNLGCKNARHQVEAAWTRSDIAEPALFLIRYVQPHKLVGTVADNIAIFATTLTMCIWYPLIQQPSKLVHWQCSCRISCTRLLVRAIEVCSWGVKSVGYEPGHKPQRAKPCWWRIFTKRCTFFISRRNHYSGQWWEYPKSNARFLSLNISQEW